MEKSLIVELHKRGGQNSFKIELPSAIEELEELSKTLKDKDVDEYRVGSIEYTKRFDNGFACNLHNKFGGLACLNKIQTIAYFLSVLEERGDRSLATFQAILTDDSVANLQDRRVYEYVYEIQNFNYFKLAGSYGESELDEETEANNKKIVSWYCDRKGIDISDEYIIKYIDYGGLASKIIYNCECFVAKNAFIYRVENQTEPERIEVPNGLKLV